MASSYQIFMGGPVSAEFYNRITSLEVEENADMPGALQMRLPLARNAEGDLTEIHEAGIQPLAPIAVVATAEGKPPECIFDGHVLSHKLHVESGVTGAWAEVYAQDAAWLMNLEERTREWANTTDGLVANSIFGEYGIAPLPDNLNDDSPAHTEDGHTLMQRATDIEFLRMLARRSGKWCRVAGGLAPGAPVGVFARPKLDASPVVKLRPNDTEAPNVRSLDIEWDVMRPTSVRARQALFTDDAADGASADTDASGLAPLADRNLAAFAGRPMTTMLTTPVDDAGELTLRAQAVLAEAGWFVRCTGEVDVSAIRAVLRVGTVVEVETMGSVHSGKYLVWSVRHQINAQAHRMRFVLVRNAVGPAPTGGGGLGGLV